MEPENYFYENVIPIIFINWKAKHLSSIERITNKSSKPSKMKIFKTLLPSAAVLFTVLLFTDLVSFVYGGCRDQERVECETVCQWNATSNQHNCNLRAVLILPSNLSYEASLTKVIFTISLLLRSIKLNLKLSRIHCRCCRFLN